MNAVAWVGSLCLLLLAYGAAKGSDGGNPATAPSSPTWVFMQLADANRRATVEGTQHAQLGDIDPEMAALLQRLIAWVAEHGNYSPTPPPRIVFEDEESLATRFYGSAPTDDSSLRVKALYDHTSGTVLLCDCWDPDDVFDRSVLLHELVHHVQQHNHATAQCQAEFEAEPYELQALWLAEQGVKRPFRAMGTDRFTIEVLSSCPD